MTDISRVQAAYDEMIAAGESHKMAELLAWRQFPGTKGTDRTLLEHRQVSDQFGDSKMGRAMGEIYRKKALAAGVNPHGKVYMHGLADSPGDPTAWVADSADVKRIAASKGLKVSGAVSYTPPEHDVPGPLDKPYEASDTLIDREFKQLMSVNPDLQHASADKKAEARHALKERRSGR